MGEDEIAVLGRLVTRPTSFMQRLTAGSAVREVGKSPAARLLASSRSAWVRRSGRRRGTRVDKTSDTDFLAMTIPSERIAQRLMDYRW